MAGLVLDASIASAWIFKEESSRLAGAAIETAFRDGGHVPSIWFYEVQNTIAVAMRRKRITLENGREACELLASIPLRTHPPQGVGREFELAVQSGLTAYDAAYLHVALDLQMPLATLDLPLRDAAHTLGIALFDG